ncbi:MAG: CRISPR-associated endonuclease Cas1 [Saprospiraceae bacterium]
MDIYLQTFGSRLRVRDGIFEMTVPDMSGNNNHLEEQYAAHEVQSIFLQKGTSVSTDALLLAIEKGVDILVLDHFGQPQGRVWTARPSSTTAIWANQLALSHTPAGLRIAKGWVEEKIRGRLEHLRKLKGYRSAEKVQIIAQAEVAIMELLAKLRRLPVRDFDTSAAAIRGLEGSAGKHYLDTLCALLPDEYQFDGRSTRPAADTFNAFLNYGYGILYAKVERALMLAGLHPHIGFMHADGYQRKNLVYDFIKQFRVWIDKTVFKLFTRKQVSATHVSLRGGEGGLWLAEDGKRLLTALVKERFQEKKQEIGGRLFPLEGYLAEAARRCASLVLHGKVLEEVVPADLSAEVLTEVGVLTEAEVSTEMEALAQAGAVEAVAMAA